MAKHFKSLPLIIVASDFKFKKFDYDRFELDYLKKYSRLEIWDLSILSSKSFHNFTSAFQYKGNELKSINSYKQLILEFKLLKQNYNMQDVFIMNFVTPIAFGSLLFLTIVKILGINSIKYHNPGVPNVSRSNNKISLGYLVKAGVRRSYFILSKIFNIFPTHCIYAGKYWENKNLQVMKKKGVNCIKGNTWDYSNILFKNSIRTQYKSTYPKKAVLLDGAGPLFGSDDALIGKKTYFTSEVWYPSLVKFLDEVEKLTNTKVHIAAHPKTTHKSNPSYFGNRNVSYGKTLEMVRNSEFVITRQSTAVFFAIFFKKPIVFIYSDQLKQDSLFMAGVNEISKLLGTYPININRNLEKFSDFLNVNELCYENYKKNYITSVDCTRTNAEILLEDIVMIKA